MIHCRMGICQSVLLQTCNTSSMTETFGHEAIFFFLVFIAFECMLCTLLNVKSCILLLWDEGRASGDWPLADPSLSFAWMTSACCWPRPYFLITVVICFIYALCSASSSANTTPGTGHSWQCQKMEEKSSGCQVRNWLQGKSYYVCWSGLGRAHIALVQSHAKHITRIHYQET